MKSRKRLRFRSCEEWLRSSQEPVPSEPLRGDEGKQSKALLKKVPQ